MRGKEEKKRMCMSTIEKTQKKESSGNGIEENNINTIQNVKMKWQKRLCVIPIMLMLWDAHFFLLLKHNSSGKEIGP